MKDNKQRILFGFVFGICLIIAVILLGKLAHPVRVDSGYRGVMGTVARIVAVAKNPRRARKSIEAGFEQLNAVDAMMSDYKPDSQLSRVNREAFAKPVKIGPELFEVLWQSIEYSRLSNGAFDITVGPLVDLWRQAGDANAMPDKNALAQAKARVGYEKLILDANERTVRFAVDGMRLDLGGIAKGYGIDKAVEAMQKAGAVAGMVDVGGDIRCFGNPPDRDAWLFGVQDPNAAGTDLDLLAIAGGVDAGQVLMILRLKDVSVVTSGDYRRFVTVAGKKVSHIIDTNTAAGAGKLSSVTVIAPTALKADALATAVSVLGAEDGLALIEALPDTEAFLMTPSPQYELRQTSGADAYLQKAPIAQCFLKKWLE